MPSHFRRAQKTGVACRNSNISLPNLPPSGDYLVPLSGSSAPNNTEVTYFSRFHRNLPFLHVPTLSAAQYPVELVLPIAAIGAQCSFDDDNAVMFFTTSRAIILERLRCRRAELCRRSFLSEDSSSLEPPPSDLP